MPNAKPHKAIPPQLGRPRCSSLPGGPFAHHMFALALFWVTAALAACAPPALEAPSATPTRPQAQPTATSLQPDTATPVPETPTPLPPTATPQIEPTATAVLWASELPDEISYAWQFVAGGFSKPLDLTHAGDGSGRLFVVEQPGTIRVIQDANVLPEPFLDIRERVGDRANEQGLLGLAFHPRYAENGYFYVNYTDQNGNTVIARFQVTGDLNRADPGSETQLLRVTQPYANHNGGALAFGPDGNLYIGLGDGGAAGDPQGHGQSVDSLLGKVLRIDVDSGEPYAIPSDNPFAGGGGRTEIWAYGLRNPWRLSFDRLTGDLYIGDVGQNSIEEIDFLPAGTPGGVNFGWSYREGSADYSGVVPADAELIPPVAEYGHGQGCSVTGGQVYRGQQLPAWQGVYVFGDYCSGLVWGLLRGAGGTWQSDILFRLSARISSFGTDESGEVYLVDHGGSVLQLVQK